MDVGFAPSDQSLLPWLMSYPRTVAARHVDVKRLHSPCVWSGVRRVLDPFLVCFIIIDRVS